MLSRADIVRLEEMNFNAWPALRTVPYDGWLLRSSGGASRRPNSVNCMTPSRLALDEKIATVEAIYRRWSRTTIFRLTPLADEGLDAALAARGYMIEEPTFVQIAEATAHRIGPEVQIFETADERWIDAAIAIRGLAGEAAGTFAAQHRAIGVDCCWMLVKHEGREAAAGVASIERGWAGLHGIYVAQAARRLGLARTVSSSLAGFAYAKGARQIWLQVAKANAAALPLYASLGFHTAYAYHHRIGSR